MTDAPTLAEQLAGYDLRAQSKVALGAKAGSAAEHERGVLYQGPWETYADGFCTHVRRCARALSLTGLPVKLRSALPRHRTPVGEDRLVDAEFGDLLHASIAVYSVQVQQVVPTPNLLARLVTHRHYSVDELARLNARRVLSTVWERSSGVPKDDIAALNTAAQAWVAAKQHIELLASEGVERSKLRWVPCPFLPDDPHLALDRRARKPGPVRCYHIGKWEPRKAQDRLLGAFLRAFRPGEAMLLLKTSEKAPDFARWGGAYPPGPAAALDAWLDDTEVRRQGWTRENWTRGVVILAKRLTGEQMLELHRMGDVYVSLSRGEGFDLPSFESKLSGNLLVFTPSGGPQDFAGEADERVEASGTVPCHPFYGWPESATYLDWRLGDAVSALRRAYETVRRGGRRRGVDLSAYEARAVGARMRALLGELSDRLV